MNWQLLKEFFMAKSKPVETHFEIDTDGQLIISFDRHVKWIRLDKASALEMISAIKLYSGGSTREEYRKQIDRMAEFSKKGK